MGIKRSGFTPQLMLLIFMLALLCASCASVPPPAPRRPLTEKEASVKIEQGDQAATLRLKESCKPTGKIETFGDEYDIKVRTAGIDANVAQILYTRSGSGTYYDVRFWKCPE